MASTSLPVFMRVGDGPEHQIGTLSGPSSIGEFLRAVADVADECEGAAMETAIRELEARLGVERSAPGGEPITVEDNARCGSVVVVDEDDAYPCGAPSRYLVERSDGDTSYGENGGSAEACDEHLAETVDGMVHGDDTVRAIVTIRWDKPDETTATAGEDTAP
jgi:hypothetical protein